MTRGQRLNKAIERWPGGGKLAFAKEMQGRKDGGDGDLQGVTYTRITSFLKDEASPSLRFLEVAAEVLGVRVQWLAFEDGEMTEEEERARARGDSASEPDPVLSALVAEFPEMEWVDTLIQPVITAAVLHARDGSEEDAELDAIRAAKRVGRALRGTIESLGLGQHAIRGPALDAYTVAMAQAIMAVAPQRDSTLARVFGSFGRLDGSVPNISE